MGRVSPTVEQYTTYTLKKSEKDKEPVS